MYILKKHTLSDEFGKIWFQVTYPVRYSTTKCVASFSMSGAWGISDLIMALIGNSDADDGERRWSRQK